MFPISIINCPSNLGLKEPYPGHEPGVRLLPDWLRQHGFHQAIEPVSDEVLAAPAYSSIKDKETGMLNANNLVGYAQQLALRVEKIFEKGNFALLLGGDCSVLLGAALALRRKGNYALFYLDGHTDFMDIHLSQTGGAGGMAASIVAGKAHPKFSNIDGFGPYIREESVWCVGNREYDDEYENEIRNSKATYYPLNKLRENGLTNVALEFLEYTKQHTPDGFWLHFDVDVLHNDIMPCVDSPTPDGLYYDELETLLNPLIASNKMLGMTITILDPELDTEGKFTSEFVNRMIDILN